MVLTKVGPDSSFDVVEGHGWHFRVGNRYSRVSYDPRNGLLALDKYNKPHSRVGRVSTSVGRFNSEAVLAHVLSWQKGDERKNKQSNERNSNLISVTVDLDWAIWYALRQVYLARCESINLYAIRPPFDPSGQNRAEALSILDKIPGDNARKASNFSRCSSEHLYYRQIPANFIAWHRSFTRQVGFGHVCRDHDFLIR